MRGGGVTTGSWINTGRWLALGLGVGALLACGPEPVDGEPFVDPNRGPVYMPPSGAGGSASFDPDDSELDDAAEKSTTLSDAQTKPVCCRICTQGKACGDSCIAAELACQASPGCACDG
jgi:hypothetical protein